MKVYFNRRIALLYNTGRVDVDALQELLDRQKIELRIVDEGALHLSVAALVGFDTEGASIVFGGTPPEESCLVLSGLSEGQLNKALIRLKETDIEIDCKAVMTNENRNWAFGALVFEMVREKKKLQEKEEENKDKEEKDIKKEIGGKAKSGKL